MENQQGASPPRSQVNKDSKALEWKDSPCEEMEEQASEDHSIPKSAAGKSGNFPYSHRPVRSSSQYQYVDGGPAANPAWGRRLHTSEGITVADNYKTTMLLDNSTRHSQRREDYSGLGAVKTTQ